MGRGCETFTPDFNKHRLGGLAFLEEFKMESGSLLTKGKAHSLLQGSDGRLHSATAQMHAAQRGRHLTAVSRKHAERHVRCHNPESTAKQRSV